MLNDSRSIPYPDFIGDLIHGQPFGKSLSPELRRRYEDFVEIAAAQLTVATIGSSGLMILRGEYPEQGKAMAGELLTQSRQIVTSYV